MPGTDCQFHIRAGHPDFLDLPWHLSLEEWPGHVSRLVEVERGISRHTVLFVEYDGRIYALKELPDEPLAGREHDMLRHLQRRGLPAVEPAGYVVRPAGGQGSSVLITGYLEWSLPYRSLFVRRGLERYGERLLGAMACLLVRLHVAGFYWGDCSLSNVLFRRDAGELGAYVVDVETSRMHAELSASQRLHDLTILQENLQGGLLDLMAEFPELAGTLDPEFLARRVREIYESLWHEITREVIIRREESYRVHERIGALNQLGFSVDEVVIETLGDQGKLKMRALVTDQSYHRHLLHNLTGMVAQDNESRLMVSEIRELKATLSRLADRSLPLSVAAFRWQTEIYRPCLARMKQQATLPFEDTEAYCQLLEHKWYLSERAGRDVGLDAALEDYLKLGGHRTPAGAAPDHRDTGGTLGAANDNSGPGD